MRSIENGEYLVLLGDGATVLCERHKNALVQAFQAANQPLEVFAVQEDDSEGQPMEAMSCQACHMVAVKESAFPLQ
jgi:hypothetical protein